jgi:hypothetical protein
MYTPGANRRVQAVLGAVLQACAAAATTLWHVLEPATPAVLHDGSIVVVVLPPPLSQTAVVQKAG